MSLGLGALDLAPSTFYCLKMNKKRLFYVAVSMLVSQLGMVKPHIQGGSGARWAFSPCSAIYPAAVTQASFTRRLRGSQLCPEAVYPVTRWLITDHSDRFVPALTPVVFHLRKRAFT